MSHTPHELAEEFPESAARLHELKVSDPHFLRLFNEYHDVNRQIHRIETRVEPASEEFESGLRKLRLRLKDEIYSALKSR
jgi:uncharacterized protein YdcH (DUF465 family)